MYAMKVAIVGAGNVGSTIAYTLSIGSQVSEILLVDANEDKAKGEVLDLRHGLPFVPYVDIEWGRPQDVGGMDIIVITAGIGRKPGQTRIDLAKNNVGLFRGLMSDLVKANDKAIYLIVSNPCDILTYLSLKVSGLDPSRVFGSGNVLDSARFRSMLGEHFDLDPANMHAYILGEHGDSSFPVLSKAFAGCTPLERLKGYDREKVKEIFEDARSVAATVIKYKGATFYAVSLGVAKIIQAIGLDQRKVMPVSSLLTDYAGVSDVCLSVPTIIDRNGIGGVLDIPLDSRETQWFNESAAKVQGVLDELGLR